MKVGNLDFAEYALRKPIGYSPKGEFIGIQELNAAPSLRLGSLHSLSAEQQVKLVLKRYELEPDFKLGFFGTGTFTKDEVITQIKEKTAYGQIFLQAEVEYCNQLIASLSAKEIAEWPKIPKILPPKIPDWKEIKKYLFIKVQNQVLFCENTTDAVTKKFAEYRIQEVHPVFIKRGFRIKVLQGTEDIRSLFVDPAKASITVYLSGIGHGSYTCYTGHGGDHILEVGGYASSEVKGKAIHFLSCQTGAKLGPDTVSNGSKCYAGYTENFTFVWDQLPLFQKTDSTFDVIMALGEDAQHAYQKTIDAFNAAIQSVPGTAAATWLTWDRDHLKLSGSGTSKITPYRFVRVLLPFVNPLEQDALVSAGQLVETDEEGE